MLLKDTIKNYILADLNKNETISKYADLIDLNYGIDSVLDKERFDVECDCFIISNNDLTLIEESIIDLIDELYDLKDITSDEQEILIEEIICEFANYYEH